VVVTLAASLAVMDQLASVARLLFHSIQPMLV
jgi:hypothetical protein